MNKRSKKITIGIPVGAVLALTGVGVGAGLIAGGYQPYVVTNAVNAMNNALIADGQTVTSVQEQIDQMKTSVENARRNMEIFLNSPLGMAMSPTERDVFIATTNLSIEGANNQIFLLETGTGMLVAGSVIFSLTLATTIAGVAVGYLSYKKRNATTPNLNTFDNNLPTDEPTPSDNTNPDAKPSI